MHDSPSAARDPARQAHRALIAQEADAAPEALDVCWEALWEACDFSWSGLADAGWERYDPTPHADAATFAQKLKRWRAPAWFPASGRTHGAGALAWKEATLQDYWRWAAGRRTLQSDEALLQAGLLVSDGASLRHVVHHRALGLARAGSRARELLALLKSRINAAAATAFDRGSGEIVGADGRAQFVGIRAVNLAVTWRDLLARGEGAERAISVRADLADFPVMDAAGANFDQGARFVCARFGPGASFAEAMLGDHARFDDALFHAGASFRHARFGVQTRFLHACFGERADFSRAAFGAGADFSYARFAAHADFSRSQFPEWLGFLVAKFGPHACFAGINAGRNARLRYAEFAAHADFRSARFGDWSDFIMTKFAEGARFEAAQFGACAMFEEARFAPGASFQDAHFGPEAMFSHARFADHAQLGGARFTGARNQFEQVRVGDDQAWRPAI